MKTKMNILTVTMMQLLFFSTICFTATGSDTISPSEQLGQQIDSLVMLQHGVSEPGGVVAVVAANGVMHRGIYGMMNLEKGWQINAHTLFDIASVSKQFTAFAIMMLEEEGLLDLDADIRQYLVDFPDLSHTVTVRHLLQHTSGLPSTDVLRLLAGIPLDQLWTQDDEIGMIKRYPYLNFEPNSTHLYSNAGYSILANIVSDVSGLPFPVFMSQRVFKPLGMNSAFVMAEEFSDPERIALGYRRSQDEFVVFSSLDDLSYGSGNIFSSLDDMIRWAENILSPEVGCHDFLQRISHPYNTLNSGDTLNYTYGFQVRKHKGVKMVEHSGGVPGFRNQFMVFPDAGVIIILMFNNESINTRTIATGIADLFLEGRPEVEPVVQRQEIDFNMTDVRTFEGRYLMPDGMEMTFVVEQDTFWLKLPGDMQFQLFAEDSHTFFLKAFEAQCTFVSSEEGPAQKIIWRQRGQDYTASRVDEVILLQPEELIAFRGLYHHSELEVDYPVTLENGQLVLHPPDTFGKYLGIETIPLDHVNGDKFHSGWLGILEFTRDEHDQIDGFVLMNVGRVQHIRFLLVSN